MSESLPRILRVDAQDNRDRVLDSARELFSESGLTVSMREIARRAGVGPATLYRRFPTKQDLVQEALGDELRQCRAIVREGFADADAWRGFCSVILRISELNARNQGFIDALTATGDDIADFGEHRREMLSALGHLARRAQAEGRLRGDFVLDDLVLVLLAGRGLTSVPPGGRTAAARRLASLAIEGFRAAESNGALGAPVRLASHSR